MELVVAVVQIASTVRMTTWEVLVVLENLCLQSPKRVTLTWTRRQIWICLVPASV